MRSKKIATKCLIANITPEIDIAITEHCNAKGISRSALVRTAVLRAIGRRDLIDSVGPVGKPPKAEQEPS